MSHSCRHATLYIHFSVLSFPHISSLVLYSLTQVEDKRQSSCSCCIHLLEILIPAGRDEDFFLFTCTHTHTNRHTRRLLFNLLCPELLLTHLLLKSFYHLFFLSFLNYHSPRCSAAQRVYYYLEVASTCV